MNALRAAGRFACIIKTRGSSRANLLSCQFRRQESNFTASSLHVQRQFWTTGRVTLLSTFVASIAYLAGINDVSFQPRKTTSDSKILYATKAGMMSVISELREQLGGRAISTDDEDLIKHGYSEWSSINIDVLPVAVAYPKSTGEVISIAKACHRHRIPIIPYSGGSSLEANFSAPFGGISVDFCFMDKVLEMRANDMDVTVQPAVGWMALNEKIKQTGLFFPVDPGPTAMIGGMVGTSCSGTNAVRYGTMKDWVVNLTVVLADGTVIKTRRRPRKSAAGYNLNGLFVGSEGTLGLVTEITLKLAVIPQETSVAIVNFPTIRAAAAAAQSVIRAGIQIAALELMDDVSMDVVNRGASKRKWKTKPTLFIKFSGSPAAIKEQAAQVQALAKKEQGRDFEFARDAEEQRALWSARKEVLWTMLSLRREGDEVWGTDVAVPLSRLAEIIEISKQEMDELGLFANIVGHVGDGNFHEGIMYNRKDPEEREKVEECVTRMVDRALAMEGTSTGEHAVGMGKKHCLVKELGLDTIDVMKKIKLSLDPHGIMNPGKIFDL